MRFMTWIAKLGDKITIGVIIMLLFLACLAFWSEDRRAARQNAAEMQRERVRFQYWKLEEDHRLERYRIDPDDALERLRVGP